MSKKLIFGKKSNKIYTAAKVAYGNYSRLLKISEELSEALQALIKCRAATKKSQLREAVMEMTDAILAIVQYSQSNEFDLEKSKDAFDTRPQVTIEHVLSHISTNISLVTNHTLRAGSPADIIPYLDQVGCVLIAAVRRIDEGLFVSHYKKKLTRLEDRSKINRSQGFSPAFESMTFV